jgi:hypothetical protein
MPVCPAVIRLTAPIFLLFCPIAAHCQVAMDEQVSEIVQGKDFVTPTTGGGPTPKHVLRVLPIPIVNPTVGSGLAVAGVYTFPSPGESAGTPRSTLAVVAGYTDSKSYIVGGGGTIHLSDDRFRISGLGGYARANLDYFGLTGAGIAPGESVGLSGKGYLLNLSGQMRLAPSIYAGVSINMLNATITSERPVAELGGTSLAYRHFGIGPVIKYDSRDSTWWPTKGVQISIKDTFITAYFDQSGRGGATKKTFDNLEFKSSAYFALHNNLVIAGNVRASQVSDGAPFFMKPSISVRGFPSGQYYESFVLEGQAELRWFPMKRIGLVGFGGGGVIAPGLDRIGDGTSALSFGAGVRYRLSEVDRMNIGVDLAFGGGGSAVYFRLGEAF